MRISLFAASALLVVGCHSRPTQEDAGPAAVAPSELGAAKKPPPLRAAHPTIPRLPDLPVLAAHDAPAPAPADTNAADQPCRSVWTGLRSASLACAKTLLFGADQGAGASLIVPRALLARSPDVLPAIVDHRVDGTEGPARDQGDVPACTAFATASAIDHALLRWGGKKTTASVMQIWSRYHSPHVEASLTSNLGLALGPEQLWPFNAPEAISWIPCDEFPKPPKACGKPVADARLKSIASNVIGEFTEIEYLTSPPDILTLQSKLAGGQDLIVAMELPTSFVPKGTAGNRYIPHYVKSGGPDAGHALLLSGYVHLPHGTYFLAHNSWGAGWGDGGYAWIHEQTLATWVKQVVSIDVEPVERDDAARPRRDRGSTTCAGDLVPDSIRGTCAPACPDKSPRHDGACPVAGQCPAAYVNLTGTCVLAAPTASGTDRATGVSWTCGPGGCAYVLPRASDPSCTGSTCKTSCPAPDFHIAKMGTLLVCVE